MNKKIRRKKRETARAQINHWLWCNITFHEWGIKPTEHGTIKQRCVLTGLHKTDDREQDLTPFRAIDKGSTRSRSTPRAQEVLSERKQMVRRGIYNSIPPRQENSNTPQPRDTYHDNQWTTSPTRIQITRSKTMDSVSISRCKQTRTDKQRIQPTIMPEYAQNKEG